MDDKLDPNTFSNYSAFNIRSLHLDIEVCFDSKILKISTETKFTVKQVEPKLLLDTEKLNTRTVHIKVPESSDEYVEAAFELQAETSVGQALCIDLSKVGPLKVDQELLVKIGDVLDNVSFSNYRFGTSIGNLHFFQMPLNGSKRYNLNSPVRKIN